MSKQSRTIAAIIPHARERDARRAALLHELGRRYDHRGGQFGLLVQQIRLWRKRAAWSLVVGGLQVAKRAIDIVLSGTALLIAAPLMAVVAVLIKRHDGGPVLFWQTRVGRWGREFPFPKFRSMVLDAEARKDALLAQNDHQSSITFKMKDDPRVTPVGRVIRKLSIDELPQLWCVLVGDMSLVGPRPPVPREVAAYTLSDRRRLDVTPGLTCFWQVSGRGEIPFDRQVELDVEYIHSCSLWLDVKLLFKTIPAVLSGRGAF